MFPIPTTCTCSLGAGKFVTSESYGDVALFPGDRSPDLVINMQEGPGDDRVHHPVVPDAYPRQAAEDGLGPVGGEVNQRGPPRADDAVTAFEARDVQLKPGEELDHDEPVQD